MTSSASGEDGMDAASQASATNTSEATNDSTFVERRKIRKQGRDAFLKDYDNEGKAFESYEALTRVVEQICKLTFLHKGIPHQVSSRVKSLESLEGKVLKETMNLDKQIGNPKVDKPKVLRVFEGIIEQYDQPHAVDDLLDVLLEIGNLNIEEARLFHQLQEDPNPNPDEDTVDRAIIKCRILRINRPKMLRITQYISALGNFSTGNLQTTELKNEDNPATAVEQENTFHLNMDEAMLLYILLENGDIGVDEAEVVHMLEGKIKDRAGVRILVYFPDDVSRIAKGIQNLGELEDRGAVVSFTRSRTDHRKQDFEGQQKGERLNYLDGPWISYASVPTEEIIQRWRHSGYRAAHLHVKLNPELKDFWDGGSPDVDATEDRFGLKGLKQKFPEIQFQDLVHKLAEVQITTMAMHVWSQVEHDIVYKMPGDILSTDTMNRMLDGINGLAITTEIMLEELERSKKQAEHALQIKNQEPFAHGIQLSDWLSRTYLRKMDQLDWKEILEWTSALLAICRNLPFGLNNRADYRQFISRHRLLETSPRDSEKLDISILILKALGTEHAWDREEEIRSCSQCADCKLSCSLLSKLLLVASSFSLMAALEENHAVDRLTDKFPKLVDSLRTINSIFMQYTIKDNNEDELRELEKFADDFLADDCCEAHDFAVALSRLAYIPANLTPIPSEDIKLHSDLFDHEFQETYGHEQAIIFNLGKAIQERNHTIMLRNWDKRWKPKAGYIPRLVKNDEMRNNGQFMVLTLENRPRGHFLADISATYCNPRDIQHYLHYVMNPTIQPMIISFIKREN